MEPQHHQFSNWKSCLSLSIHLIPTCTSLTLLFQDFYLLQTGFSSGKTIFLYTGSSQDDWTEELLCWFATVIMWPLHPCSDLHWPSSHSFSHYSDQTVPSPGCSTVSIFPCGSDTEIPGLVGWSSPKVGKWGKAWAHTSSEAVMRTELGFLSPHIPVSSASIGSMYRISRHLLQFLRAGL